MRVRRLMAMICLLVMLPGAATAQVERNAVLDMAFTMLESFNPFVARYEKITGAEVDALFPLGIPYFFGGVSYNWMVQNYPDYYVQKGWTNTIYYRDGEYYFYGFDCAGFVRWLMMNCRRVSIGSIDDVISYEAHQYGFHCYCTCVNGVRMPDWPELHNVLQPGDILAGKHGGSNHIMVYVGTLRDYGYTADDYPELEPWLDYPLVIHSSAHPAFGERFNILKEEYPELYGQCTITDGGVAISIVGVSWEEAPNHSNYQLQDHAWFELENDCLLTLVDFTKYTRYCWYRR